MQKFHTLIVGFTPVTDTDQKPRQLRDSKYFTDVLSEYNLGEVHFCESDKYKEIIDKVNPFFIITFGEFVAQEIKGYKKDVFFYVIDSPGSVFSRKTEIEIKQAKHRKVFQEIADLIQKIQEDGSEKEGYARKFAGMEYKEIYNMLIQAIVGKNEDLRQQAWGLLTNNNGHSQFVWMRAQLICEVWSTSDGKKKEEFLCLAMDQHIENGLAHKIEDFTDEDGQVFHQYLFHFVDGSDSNYIRRIPFGFKGQDKYAYEALLKKYDIPTGPQMMLEAGEYKKKREEYLKNRADNIFLVLQEWKLDPEKPKKLLKVLPLIEGTDDEPLTDQEIKNLKETLEVLDPSNFSLLFPK